MRVGTGRPTLPMTYDEYALLPRDRNRYEILDGELHMTPSPDYLHQVVLSRLFAILWAYIEPRRLGRLLFAPMDVLLSETNVVQPDLLFIRHDRLPPRGAKNIQIPPDLAVEALSPSSGEEDRVHKKRIYARHGVPHYWIVDPEGRTFDVYVLEGSEYRLAGSFAGNDTAISPVFPDLQIPLANLWA
jgi:Uma2 family endonuclease